MFCPPPFSGQSLEIDPRTCMNSSLPLRQPLGLPSLLFSSVFPHIENLKWPVNPPPIACGPLFATIPLLFHLEGLLELTLCCFPSPRAERSVGTFSGVFAFLPSLRHLVFPVFGTLLLRSPCLTPKNVPSSHALFISMTVGGNGYGSHKCLRVRPSRFSLGPNAP